MASVLIEAGHYPDKGGAPGEAQWTKQTADALAERLAAAGVTAYVVGSWYGDVPPRAAREPHALYLALHYDAAVYRSRPEGNTGCFADRERWDGDFQPPAARAADRFIGIWETVYPARTGIPMVMGRRNVNTWAYYGHRAVLPSVPAVLLECGVGSPVPVGPYPPGDDWLRLRQPVVVEALAEAVLRYLDLWEAVQVNDAEQQALEERIAALEADQAVCNAIKAEFEMALVDGRWRRTAAVRARRAQLSLVEYLIQKAVEA